VSAALPLDGKVALVTGSGRGIGAGMARAFAQAGADLALVARTTSEIEDVATEIRGLGRRAIAITADLSDLAQLPGVIDRTVAELGGVDILVNNAGGSRKFDLKTSEAQWNEALTLNFTRQRQLAHALLEQMMQRKWGRIVNLTGKSEPEGINGAFCAKAAMHSWAKGLSREVGKHGITVNCIPPGRILSEQILRNYTPEYRQWQSEHEIPVGEYGQPEDIANLVCFLASPLARYITGAVIPVDGGLRRYQF
jgi:3-oxoacyl-[acyl-carrier protein] reductase